MFSGLVRNSIICRTTVHRASAIAVKAQGIREAQAGKTLWRDLYSRRRFKILKAVTEGAGSYRKDLANLMALERTG